MIMVQIDWDVGVKTHYQGLSQTSVPSFCSYLDIVWVYYLADCMDVVLISLLHGKMAHLSFFSCEHKQRSFTIWFLCNFLFMFLLLLNLPVRHEFERDRARDRGEECWYVSLAVWLKWMVLSGCCSQLSPRLHRSVGYELPWECLLAYSEPFFHLREEKKT